MTIAITGYENLSSEYYDRVRHPTCADFRYASLQLIAGYLSLAKLAASPRILEVGAGRSVFADLPVTFRHLLGRTVVTDRSEGMLRHTGSGLRGVNLTCADADALPFRSNEFDLVIASLGDPYNTEEFWGEIRRVLNASGKCIFTTPAASWSDRYRKEEQSGHQRVAVFETKDGTTVGVPSFVMRPVEQMAFLERFGLTVTDVWTFTRDMFPDGARLSPKIARFTQDATPVVCQYVVRRWP